MNSQTIKYNAEQTLLQAVPHCILLFANKLFDKNWQIFQTGWIISKNHSSAGTMNAAGIYAVA